MNPIEFAAAKSEPVAITRTALHLPICAATKTETENIRSLAFFPWQRFALHECFLEPKDGGALERKLRQSQQRLRKSRPQRERTGIQADAISVKETAQKGKRRIEQLEKRFKTSPQDYVTPLSRLCDMRRRFAAWLRGKRAIYRRSRKHAFTFWREIGRSKVLVDELELTLADVKQGALGLLDEFLCDWWAKECGLDLQTIKPDASVFRQWLERFALDEKVNSFNSTTRQFEVSFRVGAGADKWEVLEAAVRYELRFADGARCWLDRVEESDRLTPREAEDFEQLQESADADGDRRMSREEVCAYLKTNYRRKDGETSGPMGVPGLKKLCKKVLRRIPTFPIRLSVVKKLDAARKRGVRKRIANLQGASGARERKGFRESA